MISFDGNGAPIWLIVVVLCTGVFCYVGTGLLSELTRRNTTIKDLQIIRYLREDKSNEKALVVADAYEKKVLKRLDSHIHKRTAVSLTIGVLVRETPALALVMDLWPLSVVYGLWQGEQFSPLSLAQSLVTWVAGGLMTEGLFSAMRPFVKPLSERWDGESGAGEEEG